MVPEINSWILNEKKVTVLVACVKSINESFWYQQAENTCLRCQPQETVPHFCSQR